MKSKKSQYLLLGLVLLIWGLVLFRFFNYRKEEDKLKPIVLGKTVATNEANNNTYQFYLNYRDPFLKSVVNRATPVPSEPQTPKSRVGIRRPSIQYLGLVSGAHKKTGIFKLNNRTMMCAEGDIIEGVEIVQITPDQVQVKYESDGETTLLNL